MNELITRCPLCGGEMTISKTYIHPSMDETFCDWLVKCKECDYYVEYSADNFRGRKSHTRDEVVRAWNKE